MFKTSFFSYILILITIFCNNLFFSPDKVSVAENWGTHVAVVAAVGALVVGEAVEAGKAVAAQFRIFN